MEPLTVLGNGQWPKFLMQCRAFLERFDDKDNRLFDVNGFNTRHHGRDIAPSYTYVVKCEAGTLYKGARPLLEVIYVCSRALSAI